MLYLNWTLVPLMTTILETMTTNRMEIIGPHRPKGLFGPASKFRIQVTPTKSGGSLAITSLATITKVPLLDQNP